MLRTINIKECWILLVKMKILLIICIDERPNLRGLTSKVTCSMVLGKANLTAEVTA